MSLFDGTSCVICGVDAQSQIRWSHFFKSIRSEGEDKPRDYLCQPAEDTDHETWSPLTTDGIESFQEDLAVITSLRKLFLRHELESSTDHNEVVCGEDVKLVTGLHCRSSKWTHATTLTTCRSSMAIDGNDSSTSDLYAKLSAWEPLSGLEVNVNGTKGSYLVHTQCWEYYYSLGKTFGKTVTPATFWKGTNLFYQALQAERGDMRRWGQMKQRYAYFPNKANVLTGLSPAHLVAFKKRFLDSSKVVLSPYDKTIRQSFWIASEAWEHQPLDDFPIRYAYSKSANITIRNQRAIHLSIKSSNLLASLPDELVAEIIAYMDIASTLAFASTCKRVYFLAQEAAHQHLRQDLPWLLPSTPHEKRKWALLTRREEEKRLSDSSKANGSFPWMMYKRVALSPISLSMMKRKSVHESATLILIDMLEKGLLD